MLGTARSVEFNDEARRALDMAIQANTKLDAHLTECTTRYEAMTERGNERHRELSGQIDRITSILVGLGAAAGAGLISIIVMLIRGGGHL